MADLTDGAANATTDVAELDAAAKKTVRTATTGDAAYTADWNGIDNRQLGRPDPRDATAAALGTADGGHLEVVDAALAK